MDLGRLVIGHLCCLDQPAADVALEIARCRAVIGFDRVNWDAMLEDGKWVAMVMRIVEAGHADTRGLTSDFYRRTELQAEGGPGYAKTVTQFPPMLREAGLNEATVQSFIADNPRRWLTCRPTSVPSGRRPRTFGRRCIPPSSRSPPAATPGRWSRS